MPDEQTQQQTTQEQTQQTQQTERPAWLPEKFKTPEDLAKSYSELEKKLSAPKSPLPQIETQPVNPLADDDFSVETALTKAGVTEADIAKAISDNGGKVPDDIYSKFKALGIGKRMVDDVVAQRATIAQNMIQKALSDGLAVAGGQQQVDTLFEFAKQLPQGTKDTINVLLGKSDTYAEGVRLLKTHYDTAVAGGTRQPLMEGTGHDAGPSKGYESAAAARAARNDPKFRTDPTYRKGVFERLAKTDPKFRTSII